VIQQKLPQPLEVFLTKQSTAMELDDVLEDGAIGGGTAHGGDNYV
jgi:hypothetical protein